MARPKAANINDGCSGSEVVNRLLLHFFQVKVPFWSVLLLLWFILLLSQHQSLGIIDVGGEQIGTMVTNKQTNKRAESPHRIQMSSTHVTVCESNKPRRSLSHATNVTQYVIDEYSLKKNQENENARADSFSKIYKTGAWGGGEVINGEKFGGSGPGSLMSSTEKVRKTLDIIIDEIKAETGKERISLLDMPCGDMVWMRHYLEQRMDVEYTGMDIVGSLIDHHNNVSGGEHPWRFKQHDIVKDPLQERYDLIFSRQMTQHLGTEDTMQVLQHFSDGGNYLLITNYPGVQANIPLNTGTPWRFREQNFLIEPYRLIDPICEGDEDGSDVISFYRLPLLQWNRDNNF
jgi:hypothetical protein